MCFIFYDLMPGGINVATKKQNLVPDVTESELLGPDELLQAMTEGDEPPALMLETGEPVPRTVIGHISEMLPGAVPVEHEVTAELFKPDSKYRPHVERGKIKIKRYTAGKGEEIAETKLSECIRCEQCERNVHKDEINIHMSLEH